MNSMLSFKEITKINIQKVSHRNNMLCRQSVCKCKVHAFKYDCKKILE